MNIIVFEDDELRLMQYAIGQGHTYWEHKSLNKLKGKIKEYYREKQIQCCCYCSRNIEDEFKMVLDIEHVIPKSKITSQMFELTNLAVSCKRCNMRIKKDDVSFINGNFIDFEKGGDFYQSVKYKFLHPNLDEWDDHLIYNVIQRNRVKIVYYQVYNNSAKGEYTKKYFELDKIQANTFDEAQGATGRKEVLYRDIAENFSKLVAKMLGKDK